MPIITDTNIPNKRPDILIMDKNETSQNNKAKAFIINVTIPLDENLHKVYIEKIKIIKTWNIK
jgi:hypothetical protein